MWRHNSHLCHMMTDALMTWCMTRNNIKGADGIAIGSWSFDEHMTGKYAVPVGNGRFEVS